MKRIFLTMALLMVAAPSWATDITYADKAEGGTFTHLDANEIKTAVNSKQNALTNPIVAAGAQSITGAKTFDPSMLLMKGTSTGVTTFATANTSASNYTLTFPAATGTVATVADIEALPELTWGTGLTDTSNTISVTYPVTAEAFGAGWDSDGNGATKNDVYDALAGYQTAITFGAGTQTLLATAPGAEGGPTTTIEAGTSALGTAEIASGACASAVTTAATNAATTDVINWGFNGDPTGVTGYAPTANGMLTIIAYPSSGNVNFKVCNLTAAAITPGAITLNWRIQR